MAKQSFQLDPNAVAYTDDEIVGKINSAVAFINRANAVASAAVDLSGKDADDLAEGSTNKYDTGVPPADTDALPEGAANKYDTGAPPADTDALPEGAANKYDTGTPPSDLEELPDGATRKAMLDAEKTKLTGVEANAKDDQTGEEVRDLVVALADTDRKLIITDPETGEFKVLAIHRDAAGKLEVDYDDVAES